jgi:transcriptional regulator with XRE-family HTH domain
VAGELQRRLGVNLRAYRRGLGLSQEALADVLEVHRTYMGGIERGERNLTLQSVERIAEQIEVDPIELLSPPSRRSNARLERLGAAAESRTRYSYAKRNRRKK